MDSHCLQGFPRSDEQARYAIFVAPAFDYCLITIPVQMDLRDLWRSKPDDIGAEVKLFPVPEYLLLVWIS